MTVPVPCVPTVAVPPPSYHRALARQPAALHLTALALVTTLGLLPLCCLAVRAAHRRCPPPLPRGPGGAPHAYSEESLLQTSPHDVGHMQRVEKPSLPGVPVWRQREPCTQKRQPSLGGPNPRT